jgi:hypothetical protein
MKEEVKITTKIRPEILKMILKDIIQAVEKECTRNSDYQFGDGELRVSIRWKKKKKESTNE